MSDLSKITLKEFAEYLREIADEFETVGLEIDKPKEFHTCVEVLNRHYLPRAKRLHCDRQEKNQMLGFGG